jgi:hypothetical protein
MPIRRHPQLEPDGLREAGDWQNQTWMVELVEVLIGALEM